MRLWHYALIPYLPKQQLIAQWRELNSIYKKQDNHILINFIYDYDKSNLYLYSWYVIDEMHRRGYKINSYENFNTYFDTPSHLTPRSYSSVPFENNMNNEYLKICCWNLHEKYIRGQKGFSDEAIKFIKGVVNEK